MATMSEQIIEQCDESIKEVRLALRGAILESDLSQREIEERIGYKKGYLSQVLKGHITLTQRHVLGILLVLKIHPANFYQRIFGDPKVEEPMNDVLERMARYDANFKDVRAELIELRHAVQAREPDAIDSNFTQGSAEPDPEDDQEK